MKSQIESSWTDWIYNETKGELEEKTLKIPLSMPYASDQEEFHITNISFEKDGQHFRVIKQRYQSDTLYMVYVPDIAKGNLNTTIRQWISSLTQDETPHQNGNSLLIKLFIKDYTPPQNEFDFTPFFINGEEYLGFVFMAYESQELPLHTPPPELG
ncbi:hypothetical protein J2X69_003500 [Algoriphagus sp. 4150]|uniref:hypothetical protein n=1 Tax=Algoriphagus sp. 4150 TaxID=2817756 RepID=UPI00285FBA9D|nr:hypothetical protein [Algoriphagus sp. 4150]MDR7131140.1 hypothetical protein [Algoriphagus sp. 4150]